MWKVVFSKQAAKDAKRLKESGLDRKVKALVEVVRSGPFQTSPSYEGLVGNLAGLYSRRINLQHRFVYEVLEESFSEDGIGCEGIVKVVRMWARYEGQ